MIITDRYQTQTQ